MPKTIIKRLFNEVLLFPIISDYKLNFWVNYYVSKYDMYIWLCYESKFKSIYVVESLSVFFFFKSRLGFSRTWFFARWLPYLEESFPYFFLQRNYLSILLFWKMCFIQSQHPLLSTLQNVNVFWLIKKVSPNYKHHIIQWCPCYKVYSKLWKLWNS